MNITIKCLLKELLPMAVIRLIRYIRFCAKKFFYDKEIVRRKKFSIFDVDKITQDMDLVTEEYGYNAFYGLNVIINKAIASKGRIIGAIEHGVFFTGIIDDMSQRADIIYTMSDERKMFIESVMYKKKCIAVGPYIKYADPVISEQDLADKRKQFGKTLLVFPAHSVHSMNVSFDIEAFIEEIDRIRKCYDYSTVLVCTYWKDYICGLARKFEEKKWIICSAGHIYDNNFMNRLRTIIELSDLTMSNALGTNIGYGIALGKPHYLFYQAIEGVVYNSYYEEVLEAAIKCFGKYKEYVSDADKAFVEKYWGK